ncbi:DUF427 domain-containing protein [Sandarakinorhabdus sp.]|uniref:DUF427 domain-containing protein n=1 Tax=Sandarakinorhabdus sp. TaxID=1916663 RepID=UPI00286DFA49|nr:DUF427 domain-containing protein [Sandarakinorhabdus sp.]
MPRAIWNDTIIADTPDTVVVEGNHYLPLSAIDPAMLTPSTTTTVCGWKGTANYYTLTAGDAQNKDAVWYYADPKPAAAEIKGRVAFWKGVKVTP